MDLHRQGTLVVVQPHAHHGTVLQERDGGFTRRPGHHFDGRCAKIALADGALSGGCTVAGTIDREGRQRRRTERTANTDDLRHRGAEAELLGIHGQRHRVGRPALQAQHQMQRLQSRAFAHSEPHRRSTVQRAGTLGHEFELYLRRRGIQAQTRAAEQRHAGHDEGNVNRTVRTSALDPEQSIAPRFLGVREHQDSFAVNGRQKTPAPLQRVALAHFEFEPLGHETAIQRADASQRTGL